MYTGYPTSLQMTNEEPFDIYSMHSLSSREYMNYINSSMNISTTNPAKTSKQYEDEIRRVRKAALIKEKMMAQDGIQRTTANIYYLQQEKKMWQQTMAEADAQLADIEREETQGATTIPRLYAL